MTLLKCKICGGSLDITEGQTVCECEYCGTRQTLPKLDNERKLNMYDRASHLRRSNDFDKASIIYEQILSEDKTDAEAYWSLVLCKYGVEYVEDPVSHKRIPTVNRTQYNSIFSDPDYKEAIDHASIDQKVLYEEEARKIDDIQKGILDISKKEKPYDIFICYKETDNNGRRTMDSVLAQDIYNALTKEGYKVFFSRITLEDKIGTAYEPYIFAALNSAKVMIVVGTSKDNFNAVWVKNEWSRYLSMINKGDNKTLIPAYRDMDPYDLPEEFAYLQAQDMSKLGFMQDLIRGIDKLTGKDRKTISQADINTTATSVNVDSLLKRANMFLEDGDFKSADEYFDRVLDNDPENGDAYLGKLLVEKQLHNIDELSELYSNKYNEYRFEKKTVDLGDDIKNHSILISEKYSVPIYLKPAAITNLYRFFNNEYSSQLKNRQFQKDSIIEDLKDGKVSRAIKYGNADIKRLFCDVLSCYEERIKLAEKEDEASETSIKNSVGVFLEKTDEKVKGLHEKALADLENDYIKTIKDIDSSTNIEYLVRKRDHLSEFENYKDSSKFINKCSNRIKQVKEKTKIENEKYAKKKNIFIFSIMLMFSIFIAGALYYYEVVVPNNKYKSANNYLENGNYDEAIKLYDELSEQRTGYKDIDQLKKQAYYYKAISLQDKYPEEAISNLERALDFKDAEYIYTELVYSYSNKLYENNNLNQAIEMLEKIEDIKDVSDDLNKMKYEYANILYTEGEYESSIDLLEQVSSTNDSDDLLKKVRYDYAKKLFYDEWELDKCIELLSKLGDYEDSAEFKDEVIKQRDSNEVFLPSLINMSRDDAIKEVEKRFLKPVVIQASSSDVTNNHVIRTIPECPCYIEKGHQVTIFISKGS